MSDIDWTRFYAGLAMQEFLRREYVTPTKNITEGILPDFIADLAKKYALALDKAMNDNTKELFEE